MKTPPLSNFPAVRVWDLPTRLFHWTLAICVVLLIVSGTVGGDAMQWHMRFGYCVLTLLIFRLVWGFIGGYWSRFKQFFYSPLTVYNYLRGQSQPNHEVGHNPLGALSVWGLLSIMAVQVLSGMMADDEIATAGPLAKFVSNSTMLLSTSYHKHWGKWIILALVGLHIAAIIFYLLRKKQNLIKPMLTGDKSIASAASVIVSQDQTAQRVTALIIFISAAAAVAYGVQRLG